MYSQSEDESVLIATALVMASEVYHCGVSIVTVYQSLSVVKPLVTVCKAQTEFMG